MSLIGDALIEGFGLLLECVEEQVTIGSYSHACVPQVIDQLSTITIGGEEIDVQCSFMLSRAAMLTIDSTLVSIDSTSWTIDSDIPHPVFGMRVAFRSAQYRILRIAYGSINNTYTIYCGHVDK
jgi:hypothetical protein